ncbi:class I SAM-dependent methyltransferase [Domibacillus tundrae]|uniref:class I SAM-dependent methyltransferase n=1 Tax=Domibacillus tundrae TaxID=1587527 RepID=UPI003396F168
MTILDRWLGKQLSKPRGIFSTLIGAYMAIGNHKENLGTIKQMNIQENDYLLEIGIGNGTMINHIAKNNKPKKICGIDISSSMVREAKKMNRSLVRNNIVDIRKGSVGKIPYQDSSFSKVFTVHTIYFWPDVQKGINEINRVLSPNGTIFITFTLREQLKKMKRTSDFKSVDPVEIEQLLVNNGFGDVRINSQNSICYISAQKLPV